MSPPVDIPTRLLDLPSELRHQIFRLALTSEIQHFHKDYFVVDVVVGNRESAYWGRKAMCHIFCVNKQVHREAEYILYAESIFRFAPRIGMNDVEGWLGKLSVRAKSMIQNIK
jgi:hypothetical protein